MSEIRDPIYGFIVPAEMEFEIINTSIFQRLRKIKQLAMAHLVYPGANHTRFEHSLGVFYIASLMANKLLKDNPDQQRVVRFAALLHDIGHGPFSHISEEILERYFDGAGTAREKIHEKITASLIIKNPELSKLMGPVEREKVTGLLSGSRIDVTLMKEIVSGPLDADKMDYLLRDSYFCGVQYGKYDLDRLLNTISSYEDNNDIHLCIQYDGVNSLEQFILAKYYMTKQVYRHRVRLISDAMIVRALELGIERDQIKFLQELYRYSDSDAYIDNYISHNDETVTVKLLHENPKSLAGQIFSMLNRRTLFKQIFSENLRHLDIDPNFKAQLIDISKKEKILKRKQLEQGISRIPQVSCSPECVIVKSYEIKSVKEMSKNSEGAVTVMKKDGTKSTFEDESMVFKSINEGMNEIYLEVYAPLQFSDQREKNRKMGEIKDAIMSILKKGGI